MKRLVLIAALFGLAAMLGTSLADACHRKGRRQTSLESQVTYQLVAPAPAPIQAQPAAQPGVLVQVQTAGGCQGRQAGAGCSGARAGAGCAGAQAGAGCAGGRGGFLGLRSGHGLFGFRNR